MTRRLLLLVAALVIAGLSWAFLRSGGSASHADAGLSVLVAASDLPAGSFVRADELRWQRWPEGSLHDGWVTPSSGKPADFAGAVVRIGLAAGEPITAERVVKPGDRGFMAAVLSPGMRAVTVPLTPTSSVAGFIFPGDRIDLLVTAAVADPAPAGVRGPDQRVTETLLSNLRVLALDQRVDDQADDVKVAKTATLEVTPKEAEMIALAQEVGKLSLTLRSLASGPPQPAPTRTWEREEIPPYHAAPAPVAVAARPAAARSAPPVVLVVRGAGSVQIRPVPPTFPGARPSVQAAAAAFPVPR